MFQVGIIGVTGVRVNQGISGSGNCFRESELAFGHTTRGVLATGKSISECLVERDGPTGVRDSLCLTERKVRFPCGG